MSRFRYSAILLADATARSTPVSEHEIKPKHENTMTNLKNMMKHPPTVALPRPLLGAHMCRKTLNGRYEEALITSVRAHDWVFHSGLWYSPKLESTEEVEVMNAPEVADDVVILPEPWEGEKFMSWRARAMKTDDRLRILTDVGAQLSQTWKEKSFDKGITL